MKSLKALLFGAGLSLFAVGCGGNMDTSATDAEKAKLEAEMDADMANMTGQLTEKAGEGQTPAPGGETPAKE